MSLCDGCNKQCDFHAKHDLLLEQHGQSITRMEENQVDLREDLSNIEGRVMMFTWIIGISFVILCSIAYYGTLQIGRFKDRYTAESIEYHKALNELTTAIKVQNEHVGNINGKLKDIREQLREKK